MRSLTNYAPSTFEERGAAIAFTTPLLAQTRVRLDARNRLEVLVPNISEGRGVYVVGWTSLPLAFPMTLHDRHLHELVQSRGGCSPDDLRAAALEAARCGLAGPLAVEAAETALADDAEQRLLINFQLIVEVLRAAGLESTAVLRAGLDSAEGETQTRALMMRAAAKLALEPTELFGRVAELAGIVGTIGLAGAPKPGRLRKTLAALQTFRDTMTAWSTDNVSEAAPVGAFCAEVAEHTLNRGRSVVTELDQAVGAFEALLRQWDAKAPQVRRACTRLSWLLDGWEFICAMWADALLASSRHEQDIAVNDIFRVLPLLPKEESKYDHTGTAGRVLESNRRSVRAYIDWRTGQIDADLVGRIEAIKARAA